MEMIHLARGDHPSSTVHRTCWDSETSIVLYHIGKFDRYCWSWFRLSKALYFMDLCEHRQIFLHVCLSVRVALSGRFPHNKCDRCGGKDSHQENGAENMAAILVHSVQLCSQGVSFCILYIYAVPGTWLGLISQLRKRFKFVVYQCIWETCETIRGVRELAACDLNCNFVLLLIPIMLSSILSDLLNTCKSVLLWTLIRKRFWREIMFKIQNDQLARTSLVEWLQSKSIKRPVLCPQDICISQSR